MSVSRDWDGASYDRVSAPMEALGRAVLERLALRGDEFVLDAGCGSGRVTAELVARLPRGRVLAVDASPSMVAAARARLGPAVEVRLADLCELALEAPVDAIVSTATFHWIADHGRLFARLYTALRPGGRLVAQCGGAGNVARVHAAAEAVGARAPYAEQLAAWRGPWHFATPEAARAGLERAGFTAVETWLQPVSVTPEHPAEYLATIVLGAHLERLAPDLRAGFVRDVAARLGDPLRIDYVRLNIDAARPGDPAGRGAGAP